MRDGRLRTVVPFAALLLGLGGVAALAITAAGDPERARSAPVGLELDDTAAPTIEVFDGTVQRFGNPLAMGRPERAVHIRGRITDDVAVEWAGYRVNDSSKVGLELGPDSERLVAPGDFNAEIDYSELDVGENEVTITASDGAHVTSTNVTVIVEAPGAEAAAVPATSVQWSSLAALSDGGQVIDGRWELAAPSGVHTVDPGFRRLIAVGDLRWSDYEVTATVTVGGLVESGFECRPPEVTSCGPGVGFVLRWQGHEPDGGEPSEALGEFGAIGWYRWERHVAPEFQGLQMLSARGDVLGSDSEKSLSSGSPWTFRMSVETAADGSSRYTLKFWGADETEPASDAEPGFVSAVQRAGAGASAGSIALVAHQVDATFGDVQIRPLP